MLPYINGQTGFIVFNWITHPNLTALFAHLGGPAQASNMSFLASLDDGGFECTLPIVHHDQVCLAALDGYQEVRSTRTDDRPGDA